MLNNYSHARGKVLSNQLARALIVVLLRGLKLDYNALVVVFTFAGIQIGICWNFHRIYVKLHNEFKAVVDRITEKRKKLFSDGLVDLVNRAMNDIMKQQEEKRERYELKSPQYTDARASFCNSETAG